MVKMSFLILRVIHILLLEKKISRCTFSLYSLILLLVLEHNGTIYESAGNAVREQFNKIETQQNNAFNNISVTWKNGKSLNHETEVVQANRCISEYINLSGRTLNVIIPDDNTVKYSILFF